LSACIDSKATQPEVDKSMAEGRALAVNATPTVFINGRRLGGAVPWPSLKSVIEHEIEYAKSKNDSKCCEVKIPTVPKQ
jgi:protein-disulfide isomerase